MKLFRRTKSSMRKEQYYKQQFSQLYFITIELIKSLLSYWSLLLTSFFFLPTKNNLLPQQLPKFFVYVVFMRITIIYWTSKSIPNFCGRFPWIGDFTINISQVTIQGCCVFHFLKLKT